MPNKFMSVVVLAALSLSLAGCTWSDQFSSASTPSLATPPREPNDNDMAHLIYVAAQALSDRAEGLAKDRPVIVSTIVSVDDLKDSSTFGRLASQLVADRIEQRGFLVRDVTYMPGAIVLDPKTGEMVLSREATEVSRDINAQAVVAGTYAVAGEKIYLTLRLLRADSGELLSSADVAIPLNENTRPLVGLAHVGSAGQLVTLEQFEALKD